MWTSILMWKVFRFVFVVFVVVGACNNREFKVKTTTTTAATTIKAQ